MKKLVGITLVLLAAISFSCQNDKVEIPVEETAIEKSAQITLTETKLESLATTSQLEVEFYANAEETLSRWWKLGKVWKWNNKLRYKMNHCPNVNLQNGENNGYPKVITLDYGEGTEMNNGKVLSGVIVVEVSAPKNSRDYTRLVTYENFGIDTVSITGSSLVTVDKEEDVFRNISSDLTFVLNETTTITRTSTKTWAWMEGMDTPEDQLDDVIQIEGIVEATNGADNYKKEIKNPLIKKGDCRYIVEGIVEMSLNDEVIATLDYGDGACNGVAILIKDGETREIDLKQHKMKQNKNQHQNQHQNQNGNNG